MEPITSVESMKNTDREITTTVLRERSRLSRFILRHVSDQTDAEDNLQDVFHELVDAYRLPASIEHVSGGFRGRGGWQGRRRWAKWQAMTPEERENFMRDRRSGCRPRTTD